MTKSLMRANNLTAVYAADSGQDVPAVDNVTLELPEGQILGLAGESGCGKTTLGTALAMIANPPLYVVAGTLEDRRQRDQPVDAAEERQPGAPALPGRNGVAAAAGRDERHQPDATHS